MIALLIFALAVPWLHPDSLSSTRIDVDGHEVRLRMRCQLLSLLEVIDGLDADGDGVVSTGEVEGMSAPILDYVGEHYRLFVGSDRDLTGGVLLAPDGVGVGHLAEGDEKAAGFRMGAVDIEIRYRAAEPIRDLMLECDLFRETSPAHIDVVTIAWPDGQARTLSLDQRSPRGRSDPTGRGAFGAFVRMGWHHILSGWDHLAFLLALLLATRSAGALLGIVTSFTVAHSVTLALATLGIVNVGEYVQLIEVAIALSVAYVATETALRPSEARTRWREAFAFGLLHGLGFAGFVRESLIMEESKALALVSFNVGVELGQLLVVVALVAALRLVPHRDRREQGFLAPVWLRRGGSIAVAVVGFAWFFERL